MSTINYYQNGTGQITTYPSEGSREIESPIKADGTIFKKHKNLHLLPRNGNKEFYLYYTQTPDGSYSPDFQKIQQSEQMEVQRNFRAEQKEQLSQMTVTVSSGKSFNADSTARINMISAVIATEFRERTEINWKLADNSVVSVTLYELKEAVTLALERFGEIRLIPQGDF